MPLDRGAAKRKGEGGKGGAASVQRDGLCTSWAFLGMCERTCLHHGIEQRAHANGVACVGEVRSREDGNLCSLYTPTCYGLRDRAETTWDVRQTDRAPINNTFCFLIVTPPSQTRSRSSMDSPRTSHDALRGRERGTRPQLRRKAWTTPAHVCYCSGRGEVAK